MLRRAPRTVAGCENRRRAISGARCRLLRRLLPAAAVAVAAVIAGCGMPGGAYFGKVADHPDPTHLRWCNNGEPEYIDPALVTSTTGLPLAYALFDGLTRYNLKGTFEPSVATSWEISPDERVFTFHLRHDAKWSDGRPLTSHDFAYQMERVLHPDTLSRAAEPLWKLKNGKAYYLRRVKKVLRDVGPFHAGDIVNIVGLGGKVAKNLDKLTIPDSNRRTSAQDLALRDLGAPVSKAYATVPAGEQVTLIELGGAGDSWAYVYYPAGDGAYGWVPAKELTGQPNGDVVYTVREVPPNQRPGVDLPPDPSAVLPQAKVKGKDLLMLPQVLGIRTPDDYTLVLETWAPLPYLIDESDEQMFRATPRWVVSRWPRSWTKPEHIVTSGPFVLKKWAERDRLELYKSPTYWDRDHIKLQHITVYSMNDQAASANYYMEGGCDALAPGDVPTSYLPVLSGDKRGGKKYADYSSEPYLGIYFYLINTRKYKNVHFRRALDYAVDRQPLPDILHGGQVPSAQFTPGTPISRLTDAQLALCGVTRQTPGVALIVEPGKLCYVPPRGLDFNLKKAHEELALAKKQMGAKFPSSFTVKFNTGVEGHKLIAEYMQQQWTKNLGLHVELESQEWKTFLKDTAAGEYDVARMGDIGNFPSPESEFMQMFKCDNPDNRTKFCNPKFQALMKKAEATADRHKRLGYIKEAERVVVQNAAVVPLYVYTQANLQKPYVRDLAINFPGMVPLAKAWIDPNWKQHEGEGQR